MKPLFEAYSRGELSRAELGRRMGREQSFGELVLELRRRKLNLPRFQVDPTSPGSQIVRQLAARRHGV